MRGITDAQKDILAVLVHGGSLTADQIATDARLLGLRTRIAIIELKSRGAIRPSQFGSARYHITTTGKALALALGVAPSRPAA